MTVKWYSSLRSRSKAATEVISPERASTLKRPRAASPTRL